LLQNIHEDLVLVMMLLYGRCVGEFSVGKVTSLSPLATSVYRILRLRLKRSDPRITYGELARQLRDTSAEFETITHRSRALYASLGEIGRECRRLKLPPLPALVVRADSRRPGDAYYKGMPAKYRGERIALWRRDLEAVKHAKYPVR
jgi:hypothetical protein